MAGLFGYTKEERKAANDKAYVDNEKNNAARLVEEKRLLNMPIRKTEGGKYGVSGELAPVSRTEEAVQKTVEESLPFEKGTIPYVEKALKDAGVR